MKKLLSLAAALVLALALITGCGRGGSDVGEVGDLLVGPMLGANVETPNLDIDRPFYEFHLWYGYVWRSGQPWGEDATSAHWGEMFNIYVRQSNPDANAMEVLSLMITANDLPDAIWMERDAHAMDLARLGLLYSVAEMEAMVNNTWFRDYVGPETQALLSWNGVNYGIPNWARTGTIGVDGGATGGNFAWMVTTNVYEAVGSPVIRTFEDLFDYAVAVRDANLTNSVGAPIIPLLTNDGPNFGTQFVNGAIFRSMGGAVDQWWYTILPDGTYGSVLRIPEWREAVFEANRWFTEGLFPVTNLTNTVDDFRANLNTGRGGLIWYDHSQDDAHSFRRILREGDPGNSIEIITIQEGGRTYLYPPARGLPLSRIYHEHHNTTGWNSIFVTRQAERPDRIFEFFTWLLTPMGSIEMMYGPRGELWDSLDHNGNPVMRPGVFPSLLPAEEVTRLGLWRWDLVGASNHVDDIKFAVNESLPEEYRSWVESQQANIFTPRLRLTNEFVAIMQEIDGTSPLGIQRQQIGDRFEEVLPQAIMAGSRAEAERILDDMLAFAEGLNLVEIERVYNARFQYNLGTQGGRSIFRPPGTP
ncbi:MAG: hypothetical protein FWC16_13260 [Defluviitaleaceae bacterium]|nr:hypothetical protein [Defluviitaleaceae bacterium]MCL2275889.1 hypothetical protein [Defluviitaleaceae bacterium]